MLMRLGLTNRIIYNSDFKSVDFSLIRKPTMDLSQQSQFWSKIDHFWSKFDLFWLKDWYKDWKGQLKDQKSWLKDRIGQFLSKKVDLY